MEEHARFMDQMDIVLYSQWALRVNCRTDDYDEFQKHMTLIRRCRNNGATYAQISNYLDKITLKYRQ
jgi:hypothetical protein